MQPEYHFLDAIRDSPHDDTARLVFADWLVERGEPGDVARGEFIVAQCTRSQLEAAGDRTSDAYRRAVVAEALTLTPARKAWFAWMEAPDNLRSYFDRGFPCDVWLEHHQFRTTWIKLAKLPIRTLSMPAQQSLPVHRLQLVFGIGRHAFPKLEIFELVGDGGRFAFDAPTFMNLVMGDRVRDDDNFYLDGVLGPKPPFDECCIELWQGASMEPWAQVRIRENDRVPKRVEVLSLYSRNADIRTFLAAFGPERRTMTQLQLTFTRPESYAPLFEAWNIDGLEKLGLFMNGDTVAHDTRAFALNHVGRGLRSFETTIPLDDNIVAGLAEAKLGELEAHGGGSLDALARILAEHPIHTLSLRGFPSAKLVDLIIAHAPPTLAFLTFSELAERDVPRLACARLARLLRLWIQLAPNEAPGLLGAPELADVPWIHCGKTNRHPGPNANPYAFRRRRT